MSRFVIVFVDSYKKGRYSFDSGDKMEIGIFYSRKNISHQKAAAIVRKAVKNLGIMAKITEREAKNSFPRIIVDGFDLTTQLRKPGNGSGNLITYDSVLKALERTAW